MNETINNILKRRSVRSYIDRPVEEEKLDAVLQAAVYAPSSKNRQPWRVTAIVDPLRISRLNDMVKAASQKPGFNRYAELTAQASYSINFHLAPVFIIVSVDRHRSSSPEPDGAVALASIFIAARSLGLGTCWINQLGTIDNEPGFRGILSDLDIPSSHKIVGCTPLGYPAEGYQEAPPRANALINIVK